MIIAVPGSGKTTTIASDINSAIQNGIDSRKIYAVSFTRESAGELRAKISGDVNVSTIHSLAYGILSDADIERSNDIDSYFYNDLLYKASKSLDRFDAEILAIDEAQDLSEIQYSFLESLASKSKRLIVVGDPWQCQPPNTMVRMGGGTVKRISEIHTGDTIISYNRLSSTIYKSDIVTETSVRNYTGLVYTLVVGPTRSDCTPNHRWLVKWKPEIDLRHRITYLMRKGNWYRVGHCQLFQKPLKDAVHNFHLGIRARLENADAAWILKMHTSKAEAYAYEQLISAKYGIPQMVFKPVHNNKNSTPEYIAYVYNNLSDQEEKAKDCLIAHNRDINYPFYDIYSGANKGGKRILEVVACNILPDHMLMPLYPEKDRDHAKIPWIPLSLEVRQYSGKVYSLDVAKYHTYVSDGIITCNSIFGFQGSDSKYMYEFKKLRPNIEVNELSKSYRLPSEIASHLNSTFLPSVRVEATRSGGLVSTSTVSEDLVIMAAQDRIRDNTGVLLRTNAEIIGLVRMLGDRAKCMNITVPLSAHPYVALASAIVGLGVSVTPSVLISAAIVVGGLMWNTMKVLRGMGKIRLTKKMLDTMFGNRPVEMTNNNATWLPVVIPSVKKDMYNFLSVLDMYEEYQGHTSYHSVSSLIDQLRSEHYVIESFWQDMNIDNHILTEAVMKQVHTDAETYHKVDNGSSTDIMTIHSSKGKEFERVVLPVNIRSIDMYDPEELRVLYVGCSRAKEHLDIILPGFHVYKKDKVSILDVMTRTYGVL